MFLSGSLPAGAAALGIVLLLIGAAWLAVRRHPIGRGAANRRLAAIETIALDRQRRLHLVRCDDRYLLLQTGGATDLMLGWLPVGP